MSDEATQLQAVMDALTAANAFPMTVDQLQRNPTGRPKRYTEVAVTSRAIGNPQRGAQDGMDGWRILTRTVALTEDDAREVRKRYTAALRYVALGDSTPVQRESEDPISGDDGWFSGLTTWTYTT